MARQNVQAWCSRHHVTDSKANVRVPKSRRAYFDYLPAIGVKQGEFADLFLPAASCESERLDHEERIHRRILQFPQWSQRARSQLGRRQVPMDVVLPLSDTASGCSRVFEDLVSKESEGEWPPPEMKPDTSELMAAVRENAVEKAKCLRADSRRSTSAGSFSNSSPKSLASTWSAGNTTGPFAMSEHTPRLSIRRAGADSAELFAANGVEDDGNEMSRFTTWATAKHYQLTWIWRRLDADGSMSLHKNEFINGMRKLGYPGGVDRLWTAFDRDTTGTVSFLEFSPRSALLLAQFKHWITKQFGNSQKLFQALDEDRSGSVTYREFASGCERLGCPSELRESVPMLFSLIDSDTGGGAVSTPSSSRRPHTISPDEMVFFERWRPLAYLWEDPDFEALERFREALCAKYHGNALLAWRRALDKDSSMRISYDEFVVQSKALQKRALPEAAPVSGVASLYVAMDSHRRGWASLRDWDEEAYNTLRAFVLWCRSGYTSCSKFLKYAETIGVDDDAKVVHGGVPYSKFSRGLRPSGLTIAQRLTLFEALQSPAKKYEGRSGHICAADVAYLAAWDPDGDAKEGKEWDSVAASRLSVMRPTS